MPDGGRSRQRLKRASGFFRTQNARAALPQNCSNTKVKLARKSENGTRVLIWDTEVPACKLHIARRIILSVHSDYRVMEIGKSPMEGILTSDHLMTRSYCENTILPGDTPVVKAFPVISVTSPLDVLYV